MDQSPFGSLPAEIRNLIFECAMREDRPIRIAFDAKSRTRIRPVAIANPLALSRTCKDIRRECHLRFFAINQFHVREDTVIQMLLAWEALLQAIGNDAVKVLHGLQVELNELLCFCADPPARATDDNSRTTEGNLFKVMCRFRAWQVRHSHCEFEVVAHTCFLNAETRFDLKDLGQPWRKQCEHLQEQAEKVSTGTNNGHEEGACARMMRDWQHRLGLIGPDGVRTADDFVCGEGGRPNDD